MTSTLTSDFSDPADQSPTVEGKISGLLAHLGEVATVAHPLGSPGDSTEMDFENRLAMVRLGIATSLFYALRIKHPPTAAHSLRVALTCSAWSQRLGLEPSVRDRIEVAALLHDVGKIGIPDSVLQKPGKLSTIEQLTMDRYPDLGCEILQGCTEDPELLAIVQYSHSWYDSRRADETVRADELPLGARMLAIVGAFDAMTTNHVYRPALSRERATAELLRGGGVQFDPELVHDFSRMLESQASVLQNDVITRWLQQLRKESSDGCWRGGQAVGSRVPSVDNHSNPEQQFHLQLLKKMRDGVLFVDRDGSVTGWNLGLERLTGIPSAAVLGNRWLPELIGVADDRERPLSAEDCPIIQCLKTGLQSSKHLKIRCKGDKYLPVYFHVSGVQGSVPGIQGAIAIVHDASHQKNLEERLVVLHEQATKDSLTGTENRGQFDQMLAKLTRSASDGGPTFSLIICDIDYFKRINDVHGHQAGDEALVCFADILKNQSRDGDYVCRYGGEEFVLLSSGCDNPTATQRAESVRQVVESTPLSSLKNNNLTASFGVTEFQAGDSPETVLARADRALLRAKDTGRNQVVQLGSGNLGSEKQPKESSDGWLKGWFSWFDSSSGDHITESSIVTPVPADIVIEKLKGFIADHNAEVLTVAEQQLVIRLNVLFAQGGRRRVDQRIAFEAKMTLTEQTPPADENRPDRIMRTETVVDVQLYPVRSRDRRLRELSECAKQVIMSLKSYLMGSTMK